MTDQYRIGELERRLGKIEDAGLQGQLNVVNNKLDNLSRDLQELRDEVRATKRALIGATVTLLGGMILFLVTFTTTGLLR